MQCLPNPDSDWRGASYPSEGTCAVEPGWCWHDQWRPRELELFFVQQLSAPSAWLPRESVPLCGFKSRVGNIQAESALQQKTNSWTARRQVLLQNRLFDCLIYIQLPETWMVVFLEGVKPVFQRLFQSPAYRIQHSNCRKYCCKSGSQDLPEFYHMKESWWFRLQV